MGILKFVAIFSATSVQIELFRSVKPKSNTNMASLPNIKRFLFIALIGSVIISAVSAARCSRHPKNASRRTRMAGDGGYSVFIGGEPNGYIPGKIYNGKSNEMFTLSKKDPI